MLANIIGKSVRINAIRTLASQSGPLPMPKTDFDFKLENFKVTNNPYNLVARSILYI